MVSSGKGRLFRRKDGKYLIYLPKDVAEDSQFPYHVESVSVKITFDTEKRTITAEPWKEQ